MSLKSKLLVAFVFSIAILGGVLYIVFQGPGFRNGPGPEEPAAKGPQAGPSGAKAAPAGPKADVVTTDNQGAEAEKANPSQAVKGEWSIAGRIVRAGPEGSPAAPAAGVAVHLKPHPRKTKPEMAPPPAKKITGPDGKFGFAGIPGGIWMRLEIDEPQSAFRTLSFALSDSGDGSRRRDLGDIPLEPGHTVEIRLAGPAEEPVEKATVLVGRTNSNEGPLAKLGISESRQEATEKDGGSYVLDRVPPGPFKAEAQAPGYARGEVSFEIPRQEPVILRLEKGLTLSGIVKATDGKPLEGAEVRIPTSDPPPKATTDASGRFTIDSLSAGNFYVIAEAKGYAAASKNNIAAGTQDLEFVLDLETILAGKVISDEDGAPLAKATVNARLTSDGMTRGFQVSTDTQGSFELKGLTAGQCVLTADHEEFASTIESRELTAGESTRDLVLRLKRGLQATGKVADASTNEPIAGAQVFFNAVEGGSDQRGSKSAKTGPDGTFTAKGLQEGRYVLSAQAKGFLPGKNRTITVVPDGSRDLQISLEPGSSISGRVLSPTGEPVALATVRPSISASPNEGWDERLGNIGGIMAQTNAEGLYILEGLPASKNYIVQATHKDYAAGQVPAITLGEREVLEGVDVKLTRGGSIRGRVTDESGSGITGVNLYANPERSQEENQRSMIRYGSSSGGQATTDAAGNYVMDHVPEGTYTVRAQSKDRLSATQEKVAVGEDQVTEKIDFVLAEGESISGRVVDDDGNPIAGAYVNAYGSNQNSSSYMESDKDGNFRLKGLKPGPVYINAGKSGFYGDNIQANVPAENVVVKLQRSGTIAGILRAKGQDSFRDFTIMATQQEGNNRRSFSSQQNDPSGRFEVSVAAGTYVLRADVRGFIPAESAPITVKKGERVEGIVIDLEIGGTVRVTVLAKATREPVEGATVRKQDNVQQYYAGRSGSEMTGPDGLYLLEGIPEGSVDISVEHKDFAAGGVQGIPVRTGEVTDVTVELTGGGGIRGTVSRGGEPLSGASVYASTTTSGNRTGKNATTDAQGRFEIQGLAAGEYQVVASPGGPGGRSMRPTMKTVTVPDEGLVEVDLEQEIGISVRGRITVGGEPIGQGHLIIAQVDKGGFSQGEIDSSGNYTAEVPGPGTYSVIVSLNQGGESGFRFTLKVPEGAKDVVQDFEPPTGQIAGVVVDGATGDPVPRAQVIAMAANVPFKSFTAIISSLQSMAQTDGEGRFILPNMATGTYTVQVFVRGYANVRVGGIRVVEGRRAQEARIALEKGVPFQAKIVDGKGQPIAQAVGFLRDAEGNLYLFDSPAMSKGDGVLDITGATAGDYQLCVIHQSYAPSRAAIRITPGAGAPTVVLKKGNAAKIQIVDGRGGPIQGASVDLVDEKGESPLDDLFFMRMDRMMQSNGTGADGTMELGPLAPGTYRISAKKGEARTQPAAFSIEEDHPVEVRLTLE